MAIFRLLFTLKNKMAIEERIGSGYIKKVSEDSFSSAEKAKTAGDIYMKGKQIGMRSMEVVESVYMR